MTSRVQQIFEQIIDLPPADRLKALDRMCRHSAAVRAQVESLLAAHESAGSFLGDPTLDYVAAYSEPLEQAGATIGRYKLLEKIGQGGFGDVFMAQQVEPVKRRVALKIIKLGMDTKQVVARFEAERQALALMDHPNIAQVLDGGETASGRPYFVMELVRGDPITSYCDHAKLSTRSRLKLFQQVCQAIQHAHHKGVIHRDIKPSNVLVTIADGHPLVKVIDFGIAKATNTELTEKTLYTEFRQLIGTPQYMSPEQAERSGVDIDTRSDIYSLGVLLYELLTGRTPLDPESMKAAVWEEIQRKIVDEDATRPSVLVTSLGPDSEWIAASRGTQLIRLRSILKGDLDWIVLKALDKDRTRRYGTAGELSNDIQRFLDDETVLARPSSVSYRLQKLVRRNKAAVAATLSVFFALLVGLIATSVTSVWALRERDNAQRAELEARQATDRAMRMLAISGSPVRDPIETHGLVDAWFDHIDQLRRSGEPAEEDVLTKECQLATWWFYHGGGIEAATKIEQLYPQVKEELGLADPNFYTLVNANIISHLQRYDADQMADLFGELVSSARILYPDHFESLLPQLAAALHKAGRGEEATSEVKEYLELRRTSRPQPVEPAVEKIRLRGAIRDLSGWGKTHPSLMQQLEALQQGLPDATAN
jgi:serine/threonine protein kinase